MISLIPCCRCNVLKVPEGRYCEGCWQARKGWLPDRPKPPHQRPKLPTRRQRNAQRDKRAGAAAATAAHRSSSDETDGSQKGDDVSAAVAAACDSGFGSQEVDTMDEGAGNAASQELAQPAAKNAIGSAGAGGSGAPPAKNAKGSGDPAAQVGEEPPLKAMEIVDRKLEEGVGAQMMVAGFATANFVLQEAKGLLEKAQVLINLDYYL
jgi:hypothetical protein